MVDSTLMGLQIYWNIIKHTSTASRELALILNGVLLWSSDLLSSQRKDSELCRAENILQGLLLPVDFLTSLTSSMINQFHQKERQVNQH